MGAVGGISGGGGFGGISERRQTSDADELPTGAVLLARAGTDAGKEEPAGTN